MALSPKEIDEILEKEAYHDCGGVGEKKICVKIVAIAELPSRFGKFQIAAFWNNRDAKEHVAMIHGDVVGASDVAVRLHSECLTGDVMGSLRCDCRDQLVEGLAAIQREKSLKKYKREWKVNLIEQRNRHWDDLAAELFGEGPSPFPPLPSSPS